MNNERKDWLIEELKEKENEIEKLKDLLRDASNQIAEWGSYADKYYQEKWDLEGTLKKFRKASNAPD